MLARVGTSVREDNQSQVQLEVATGQHLAMLCPNKRGIGRGEGRFLRPATDGFGAGAMQRCENRHGRYECLGGDGQYRQRGGDGYAWSKS